MSQRKTIIDQYFHSDSTFNSNSYIIVKMFKLMFHENIIKR